MKKLLYGLAIFYNLATLNNSQADNIALVFVHLGPSDIPHHALTAIAQARLFNADCPFYFIMQQKHLSHFSSQSKQYNVSCIAAESLSKTPHHIQFLSTSTLSAHWEGFWRYATERFFYIEELMRINNLSNVFHIENDIMIYVNLRSLLPTLKKYYKGIGATFCCDSICIPGFLYIPSVNSLYELNKFIAKHAPEGKDDCITLAHYKNTMGRDHIDYLPTVCPEYAKVYALKNQFGEQASQPSRFSQYVNELQSIFDGAALGQYLGGISPRNNSLAPGYINQYSVFNPQNLTLVWHKDSCGRNIPYVKYGEIEYLINNLHIHSKNLKGFRS